MEKWISVEKVIKLTSVRTQNTSPKDPGYMMLGAKKRRGRKTGGDLENMAGTSMLRIKGY